VLDVTIGEVLAFTWEGVFLRSFGNGIGDGPGEIRRAFSICVDDSQNVYVTEHSSNRINMFRSDGTFLRELRTPFLPRSIAAIHPERIYLTRAASVQDHRLVCYSVEDGILNEAVPPDGFTELVMAAGFRSEIDRLGDMVVYASPYPYAIRLLSAELEIVGEWMGKEGVVDIEPVRRPDRTVDWNSMIYYVIAGRDSLIYAVSKRSLRDAGELIGAIDVYARNGRHLARIPHTSFGFGWFYRFVVDENHILAAAVEEPFPSVIWIDLRPWLVGASER